jgi:hypothetical protein
MGWYAQTKRVCAVAGAVMLAAALCTSAASAHPGHANEGKRSRAAAPPHVMVIMMENTDYSQAIGSPAMPYLNELAHQYAGFTQSFGWQYPSLPNYVELLSGSTVGINSDCDPGDPGCTNLMHERFVDQLEASGISWHDYFQDDVSGCDTDPSDFFHGNYDVEHNALAYFADFATQCTRISNFGPMFSDLSSSGAADYNFVVPDLDNDGGDNGTMASGDTWLSANVPEIMKTRWYRAGGQIVILYDTGYQDDQGLNGSSGGRMPPIVVVSAHTRGMGLDSDPLNTAGVLRSLETAYRQPLIGDAADPDNGSLGDALVAGRPTGPTPKPAFTGAVLSTGRTRQADVDAVKGSLALNGVYRYPDGSTVTVGENARGQGVVDASRRGAVAVPGTSNLESVSCPTSTTCWAVGLATSNSDQATLVKIVSGRPVSTQRLSAFYALYGIDCPTANKCEAVGYDTEDIADAVTTITNGNAGAPIEVPGGGEWLNAISCASATDCYAVGLVNFTASVVPISDGTPRTPLAIPNGWYVNGIDCTSVGNCLMVGESGDDGEGFVSTLVNGAVGDTTLVPGTEYLYGAGCAADGHCLLAGASHVGASGYSHGVLVRDDDGELGDVQGSADTNGFNQVTCGATLSDCATVGAQIHNQH